MQLGLDPQYPGFCLLRRRPRSARIHDRPPGIPTPRLRTCCLPSPCGRLSRPPWWVATPTTNTEAPSRLRVISRRRTCPLATWMANQEGDPRRFPRSLMRPVDEVGAQLCPGSLAMATPQTFTMASGPAISPGLRSRPPRPTRWTRAADRPISARFGAGTPLTELCHWFTLVTPSRLDCRTQAVWQYQPVPSLSGLLPPSLASPRSGCPHLPEPAATGPRRSPFISARSYGASWRTTSSA
jgi:hypothetical protein